MPEKHPSIASKKALSPIESGAQFVLENLFKGDLALWDKELKDACLHDPRHRE